jgi:hypothetical protein
MARRARPQKNPRLAICPRDIKGLGVGSELYVAGKGYVKK